MASSWEIPSDYAPAVLKRLGRFSDSEAQTLVQWLRENPIGTNLALRLLERLEDLRKKENRPLRDFFLEMPAGLELQPKDRGKRWCENLEKRLHPHLKQHSEAFSAYVRGLGLPEGVEVEPPQGFEGRTFLLRISFSDPETLKQRLQSLEKSLEQGDWTGLWKF